MDGWIDGWRHFIDPQMDICEYVYEIEHMVLNFYLMRPFTKEFYRYGVSAVTVYSQAVCDRISSNVLYLNGN